MKKNKLIKLRKSRIREIIKEEILKLKEQSPSTPTNSTLNYQNGQYQFHFCEAVTPPNPTTNIQANNMHVLMQCMYKLVIVVMLMIHKIIT